MLQTADRLWIQEEEFVDAGLKALFEQHRLGALCEDVCMGLGVECVDDLVEIEKEHLDESLLDDFLCLNVLTCTTGGDE